VILFPRGVGGELSRFARLGEAAISLDTATPMAWAVEALPDVPCLQGNLDPELLVGPVDTMLENARGIVRATRGRAHIFNLGHGIVPTTPPENVAALVADLKSAAA
jgi:uroporphyrinogen decarboxylase